MKFFALRCDEAMDEKVVEDFPQLQVLDAKLIAGEEHISFAIQQAERAFRKGRNISSREALEVLVRASAQTQIREAIERLGVEEEKEVVVIAPEEPEMLMERYGCRKVDLELTPEKLEGIKAEFGIGKEEIKATGYGEEEAVKAIVRERIALLNL